MKQNIITSGGELVTQLTVAAISVLALCQGHAQTFTTIKSFGVLTNVTGGNLNSPLVQGLDGTLYGTAYNGEGNVRGTIFRLNSDGTGFAVLKWFTNSADGANPQCGLTLAGDTLYGTTYYGGAGYGTVFKINTNGTGYTVLKNFAGSDGWAPAAGLLLSGNILYGTTVYGGSSNNGTVFEVNTDGTGYAVLKNFTGPDGSHPISALALSGGTLYGTTWLGGSSGYGTVFKVNTNATGFTVLTNLASGIGSNPVAGLLLSNNVLYGTASAGGGSSDGVVFKINTDGTGYTILKSFAGSDGASPQSILTMSGSTLFGTTTGGGSSGYGTVFAINTNGTGYTVLKDFAGSDGADPDAGLMLSGSILFGTTYSGGSSNFGTVFKINTNGTSHTVLKNFAYSDAQLPYAGVTFSNSVLYGTTELGGSSGYGAVFKVNADGTGYAVLKSFTGADGSYPMSLPTLSGGTLFGTAYSGGSSGYGTVFKVNTNGTGYTVLKNFAYSSDGAWPRAGLAISNNMLFGTTPYGAASGSIFKLDTNGGGYTLIKTFSITSYNPITGTSTNADGATPYAGLTFSGGTLYGTTLNGGLFGYGTVFKVNTDGSGFTVLKHFANSDGASPYAGVVLSGSTLYGTTYSGGSLGHGTVFKVNTDGMGFAVLKDFTNSDGAFPYTGLTLWGNKLFGTTQGGGGSWGTAFMLNTDGTGFTVLKNFTDASNPQSTLAFSGGTLYGTTVNGGDVGDGTVFSLILAPVINSQPVSQTVPATSNATFNVSVSSIETPVYQWYFNNSAIPGATNNTFAVNNAALTNQGNYQVVVTNTYGATTSAVAALAVFTTTVASPDSFAVLTNTTLTGLLSLLTANDIAGSSNSVNTNLTIVSISSASAQAGSVQTVSHVVAAWTNLYSGPATNDVPSAVGVDNSGNVFVTGYSVTNGTYICATIKYSASGVPLWTNRSVDAYYAQALAVDSTGNVFMAGGAPYDYVTIKYSTTGVALWTNRYDQAFHDTVKAIAVGSNGNLFVTGSSGGDYATVGYANSGSPLWTNGYPSTGLGSAANAVAVDGSGNVFVTGYVRPGVGGPAYGTIKYSSAGVPLWTNLYYGPQSNSVATAMTLDAVGNVFVTGWSVATNNGYPDYVTIKYSNAGVPLWTNRYVGPSSGGSDNSGYPTAMAVDSGGNVAVTGNSRGYTTNTGSQYDFATVEYSNAGVPLWTNRYDSPISSDDQAGAIVIDSSGTVYVSGYSYGVIDYATIAYSSAGIPLWTNRFAIGEGPASEPNFPMALDGNGNVFVTHYLTIVPGTKYNYATIKYTPVKSFSYTPPANFSGVDTFSYVVRDSLGIMSTGMVSVTVYSGLSITTSGGNFGFANGQFGFNFAGTSGSNVVIQASTNLQTWVPLITNVLGNAPLYFSDPLSPSMTRRFYRAVYQP